ncbi:Pkinase-domain-containing protein [Macrolepiota fuliginosa MF-IS2]|uniref:Pkinase-domain-containing protein n=1 Tax=Macrolepiota fuliginosa MF-IS2 TaxID=1400762 RepID=A0A9P5XPS6_9AGAR|nr:Pkinase-domain-containing protein [Macrolepiota fuliginosa MF-IS2]
MASISPSASPPRTPVDLRTGTATTTRKSATPPSDDSYIEDLSFDYVLGGDGNMHRISKGSAKSSPQTYTPPTPPDDAIEPRDLKKPPSPISLNSPIGRTPLSRSESAHSVLETVSSLALDNPERPARSFSRVASGPLLSNPPPYAAPTASSAAKPRTAPRRITLDDISEPVATSSRPRQALDSQSYPYQDDKENISESDENPYQSGKRRLSPSLTSRSSARPALRTTYSSSSRPPTDSSQRASHARQVASAPNRPGRMLKAISTSSKYSSSALDRYHDTDASENEYGPTSAPPNHSDRNSPTGIAQSNTESDLGEDAEVDPTNIPIPSSATSSMFGRQKHLVVGTVAAASSFHQSSSNRPRRSASFSDALAHDDYQLQVQQQYVNGHSRPGTSLGMSTITENTDGARRVTREQQEAEILKYIREHEIERRELETQPRQTPSPTHLGIHQARLAHGHRRQESDTLKSVIPSSVGSPTVVDHLSRIPSKSGQGRASPSSTRNSQGRVSPNSRLQTRVSPKGRVSPSGTKGRLSPPTSRPAPSTGKDYARHRRSPTAPDLPTTSNLVGAGTSLPTSGKTWAASEREEEYHSERERERRSQAQPVTTSQPSPPPPAYSTQPIIGQPSSAPTPQPTIAPAQPSLAQSNAGHAPPPPMQSPRHIVVNKKAYARLDMIGKGGSSRVFRVMSHNNELYAIKRVSLDRTDNEMMAGYMNEIALLKRLEGNSRIIRLIDSEVRAGPGGSKGHLLLVMECGEIDLARLLQDQMKHPLNMVWVAYYWQQMLQAVHVIHEEKIVHSDLKPANFVLVRGQLKLIDFGIANAIANDTTNIQRDHQVGTINYMSPEAIELPDGMRRLKVGRPSDVWSLGVILYQMVYGQPPFQHLPFLQKMRAIPDHSHVIEFPEYSIPTLPASKNPNGDQLSPPTKLDHLKQRVRNDVIDSMKKCLTRNSKERGTIPELLEQNWLSMKESELNAPVKPQLAADETIINPYYMRQLLQYGIKLGAAQGENMNSEALLKEAERLVAELKALQP